MRSCSPSVRTAAGGPLHSGGGFGWCPQGDRLLLNANLGYRFTIGKRVAGGSAPVATSPWIVARSAAREVLSSIRPRLEAVPNEQNISP